jgi:HD superfamily phosphohydrolase
LGDAFGADRIDYLLRDSYHAGVKYGNFDHFRLLNTLRILPREDQGSDEPALGLENGGLESSEALMLARHFIYKQVYLHPIRRVYDLHLIDFLNSWLDGGLFSVALEDHLEMCDAEVISAIRKAARDASSPSHIHASRIEKRDHFRLFYAATPSDKIGGVLRPGEKLFELAKKEFTPSLRTIQKKKSTIVHKFSILLNRILLLPRQRVRQGRLILNYRKRKNCTLL